MTDSIDYIIRFAEYLALDHYRLFIAGGVLGLAWLIAIALSRFGGRR